MRRRVIVLGLELYAAALAAVQYLNGVRTDEAKYLLNIPYPHPPLARWMFSLLDGFTWHEAAIRLLVATLLVQAVWIVWEMGRMLRLSGRLSLCILWLGSAAFILQTGTVMMAPLTALQALLFLWLRSMPKERLPSDATVGFLWFATLFTALQGLLLAPLALTVIRQRPHALRRSLLFLGMPIVLLGLYALGNPLVLASFVIQTGKDAGDTLMQRGAGLLWVLTLAGSGIGTIVGVAGLLLKRHILIASSFVLIALYVFLGRFDYYAILFLPFLITGTKHLLRRMPGLGLPTAILTLLCTALLLTHHVPLRSAPSPARRILSHIGSGLILVRDPMGHEWQYEAQPGQDVRRFTPLLLEQATAVVCFRACDDLAEEWIPLEGEVDGAWVRA